MDNQFSQAHFQPPAVPADFAARLGSSKLDLVNAILLLLKSAQITGINPESPNNFDIAEIQNRITSLEKTTDQQRLQQRTIPIAGVANDVVIVPFEDMGTNNYWVNVCFLTNNENINTVTWSLIRGSRTNTQCQIRIDGDASAYDIEVHVLQNKSLGT